MQSTAGKNKRYFYDDIDAEKLYYDYKLTRKNRRRKGVNEHNLELIDLDSIRSYGTDIYTNKPIKGFTIHYSKSGAHLIPTYNKRKG